MYNIEIIITDNLGDLPSSKRWFITVSSFLFSVRWCNRCFAGFVGGDRGVMLPCRPRVVLLFGSRL